MKQRARDKPIVALIAAVGPNLEIGISNKMPWHLPRDLRFFRKVTTGHTVIMGRKTFESLGKALPKRRNIVVSRNPEFAADNVEVAHSLEQAISFCVGENRVFVIGGGELFRQAMPLAKEMYLTEIKSEPSSLPLFPSLFEGAVFFPRIDTAEWSIRRGKRWFIASNRLKPPPPDKRVGIFFRFVIYVRARRASRTSKERSS